jgi:hypothetical protein
LPIDVAALVEGEAKPRLLRVEARQQKETLAVALDKAPKSVAFDPQGYVLMDADIAPRDASR